MYLLEKLYQMFQFLKKILRGGIAFRFQVLRIMPPRKFVLGITIDLCEPRSSRRVSVFLPTRSSRMARPFSWCWRMSRMWSLYDGSTG